MSKNKIPELRQKKANKINEAEEKIILSTTKTAQLYIEEKLKNEFLDFDIVRTHYLWDKNVRVNVWSKNNIIKSYFLTVHKDGVVESI